MPGHRISAISRDVLRAADVLLNARADPGRDGPLQTGIRLKLIRLEHRGGDLEGGDVCRAERGDSGVVWRGDLFDHIMVRLHRIDVGKFEVCGVAAERADMREKVCMAVIDRAPVATAITISMRKRMACSLTFETGR